MTVQFKTVIEGLERVENKISEKIIEYEKYRLKKKKKNTAWREELWQRRIAGGRKQTLTTLLTTSWG